MECERADLPVEVVECERADLPVEVVECSRFQVGYYSSSLAIRPVQ